MGARSAREASEAVAARLISLLLDANGNPKTKLTIFIGAGASREYGMPTTLEFARRFFKDAVFQDSDPHPIDADADADADQIKKFIQEFRAQLDSDLAYAFFRKIEEEATSQSRVEEVLTYDRIIDLWRAGYVKLVITTNFDSLFERRFEAYTVEGGAKGTRLAIFDYNDLHRTDRPNIIDARILVKIAGNIERSNMLWTAEEFDQKITPQVREWLSQNIAETPLLLLGYTASEQPLTEILSRHTLYSASVAPRPLEEIASLRALADSRAARLDHAQTTAGKFVEIVYERLFERTHDPNLSLSFGRLQERVSRLSSLVSDTSEPAVYVARNELEQQLADYFTGEDMSPTRLQVLLGDSGAGKTTLIRRRAVNSSSILSLIVPASEITTSVNEWAGRLGGMSVDEICRLALILSRRVNIIIDGLNETIDGARARAILEEIKSFLDRYDDQRVRALICCRSDSWERLAPGVQRNYLREPWMVGDFTDAEVDTALDLLGNNTANRLRSDFLRDMLHLPQNFAFALEVQASRRRITAEPVLLEMLYAKRTEDLGEHISVIIWLCREMRRANSVSLKTEELDVNERRANGLRKLSDAGLFSLNRLLVARFAQDRMGEFIFGAIYLYDYCYREDDSPDANIFRIFQSLCEEYQATTDQNPAYKAMYINALVFFLYRADSFEFLEIYAGAGSLARTLLRTSAVLKRDLDYDDAYIGDPVMLAVCLLKETNFSTLLHLIASHDYRFLSELPLNFAAKLFPDAFLAFVQAQAADIPTDAPPDNQMRPLISGLATSLLTLCLRKGPDPILEHQSLPSALIGLVQRLPLDYLSSRIVEALEENSRSLFHYHPTAKLSDVTQLDWSLRSQLLCAVDASIHDLDADRLHEIILRSPGTRLIARFLMLRDMDDSRLSKTIEYLFGGGNAAVQDYCIGILGFVGKSKPHCIPMSERYIIRMRTEYPQNFFRTHLDGQYRRETQYDPLVPHVTTLLHLGCPIDFDCLLPGTDEKTGYRMGRLAQKTVLDFPEETLAYLSKFRKSGGEFGEEIKVALRIAARFFPAVFWKHMRADNPELLFEISGDDAPDANWVVSQVRDYDWYWLYSYMTMTVQRSETLTIILRTLLNSSDLESWVRQGLEWVRTKFPDPRP